MYPVILYAVLFVLSIVLAVVFSKKYDDTNSYRKENFYAALCGLFVALIVVFFTCGFVVFLEKTVVYPRFTYQFENHKIILQAMPDDVRSSNGLWEKQIELNDELFAMQSARIRLGEWSVYPESVLDIKPID